MYHSTVLVETAGGLLHSTGSIYGGMYIPPRASATYYSKRHLLALDERMLTSLEGGVMFSPKALPVQKAASTITTTTTPGPERSELRIADCGLRIECAGCTGYIVFVP